MTTAPTPSKAAPPVARAAVLALALVTAPACGSPLLTLGSTLADAAFSSDSAERGQLVAEVVEVDELQRRIRVTTEDGRTGTVIYDQNTVVIRDQQNYTVRTLRPGDLLLIQVERNGDGHLYATRVDVQPPEPEPAPANPTADPPDSLRVDARPVTETRSGSA